MANDPAADWTGDPEKTEIPVRGDCGHIYTVALARLQDGAEFTCPVCGQADRFDEEALRAIKEQLDEADKSGAPGSFAADLSKFLGTSRPNQSDQD